MKAAIVSILEGFDASMNAWFANHPTLTANDIVIVSINNEVVNLIYNDDSQ
ncbi:MAG TPA: hypothetical protein PLW01_12495 [Agitococcus sp.]|nr:hypothetical protein [Agitococcus sp.]